RRLAEPLDRLLRRHPPAVRLAGGQRAALTLQHPVELARLRRADLELRRHAPRSPPVVGVAHVIGASVIPKWPASLFCELIGQRIAGMRTGARPVVPISRG